MAESGCIRVLYCHQGAELYGSDRMAARTARALRAGGMSVVVVLPASGPLVSVLENDGVPVRFSRVPVLRKEFFSPFGLIRMAILSLIGLVRALRVLREVQPDVVYVNTIAQPLWLVAAFLSRRPSVCHVREAETELPRPVRAFLVAPLRLCATVVCNSRSTESFVRDSSVFNLGSLVVVYNGKDWSTFAAARGRPRRDCPRLVVVGRLSPRKGQDLVLAALPKLSASGIEAHVVFAGDTFPGYEWFEADLRSEVDRLGARERVTFAGFVEDVAPLLRDADIAVVPSRLEPFGTVALEAMASGLPTVVSSVQGLAEIVEDGVTGVTFEAGSSDSLADAIISVATDRVLAQQIGERAADTVRERYSSERYDAEIVALVNGVQES